MGSNLGGKVALVSGGARGMGAAHVMGLIDAGASVVIGDVRVDLGKELAAELGDRALFIELDVTDEASWRDAVAATEATFGGLDVLVNNAGVTDSDLKGIIDMSLDAYRRVVEVNQTGVFLGMHVCALPIIRRGGGSIVNISSVAGVTGSAGSVNYTASKWAVRGMTKCAAQEFAAFGVRVNSVHPGFIRTPMLDIPEGVDFATMMAGLVPMDRMAEPDEVTRLVLFLAGDDSSYCTGTEFVIDGGLTSGIPQPGLAALVSSQINAHLGA
jgi:3alpha(or 20beta)-hydroxysteroid dehydrogenase